MEQIKVEPQPNELNYGRDLWDSVQALQQNTIHRTQAMNSLKVFINVLKSNLD